jgi:hypothetical protein
MVLTWHLGAAAILPAVGGWFGEFVLGWRQTRIVP